jgi:hypothetical protein
MAVGTKFPLIENKHNIPQDRVSRLDWTHLTVTQVFRAQKAVPQVNAGGRQPTRRGNDPATLPTQSSPF